MDYKLISKGLLDTIKKLVFICIGLYALFLLKSVIIYIATAGVIALMAYPFKSYLKREWHLSNTSAVMVVMSSFALLSLLFLSLFIPLIMQEAHNLSLGNIAKFKENVNAAFLEINQFTVRYGVDLTLFNLGDLIHKKVNNTPKVFSSVINSIGSFSVGIFSVGFISFFFIKESEQIGNFLISIMPIENEKEIMSSIIKTKKLLSRYFLGLTVQILIVFVAYLISLFVIGVSNALVIAFLCALLNLIPYVGPLIGLGLMGLLATTENLGMDFKTELLPLLGKIGVAYGLTQFIDNNFSQPIIFSKSVNSHPLEIFIVIFVFGILMGIVGMILAVPIYTVIKVVMKEFYPENPFVKALTQEL
ncbi:AI-2E family transporter [Flammeovirga sp. EKP202]|uniref:AI-2E family transporter n=1 Tax=Flammeovirga sp. EKP202 TaxID=2770592 RepID=UPI00165F09A7|nr:AI-2E family transporter [Flammeovirga sp. EKP202]MBD0400001.1 AI-2E family transporter [Flammeovirga sp. EKP202]